MPFVSGASRLFVLALLLGTTASHAKSMPEARLELGQSATAADLQAQREQIEKALAHPEAYAELRAADRSQIRASLDQMGGQLSASGSIEALPETDRSTLLAEQERINRKLDIAREDSRLVCTREKSLGSNFRRTICLSVAQRRRQSDQARGMVRPEG